MLMNAIFGGCLIMLPFSLFGAYIVFPRIVQLFSTDDLDTPREVDQSMMS